MQSVSPDYKARKQGKPTMPLKERLYSKIKINEYTGCWEWQGTLRNGYGRIIIGSRTDGTRRSEYIDLAKEYGVCKKTIMDAVKGRSWKCVNYLPAPPDRRPPKGEMKDASN